MSSLAVKDQRDHIFELDIELASIHDSDLLCERILLEARQLLNADAGTIYIVDENQLVFKYSQNSTLEKLLPPGQKLPYINLRIPINESRIASYAAKRKKLVRIDNAYAISRNLPFSFDPSFDKKNSYTTRSVLAVPLVGEENQVLGVIQLINALDAEGKVVAFWPEDEKIVRHFAHTVSSALQRSFTAKSMILRMNKMAELRDPKETGPHVNRVATISAEIFDRYAYNIGLSIRQRDKFKDELKTAALLHDVGKVGIADSILKKPGKLDSKERSVIQTHTIIGARLFKGTHTEIDKLSADIALRHHERWDGKGYPGLVDIWSEDPHQSPIEVGEDGQARKLRGEEIPLGARIVALADVYDALASKRSYKEKWELDRILEEIQSLNGKQFDPNIVRAFFQILPRIHQIQNLYPDEDD